MTLCASDYLRRGFDLLVLAWDDGFIVMINDAFFLNSCAVHNSLVCLAGPAFRFNVFLTNVEKVKFMII